MEQFTYRKAMIATPTAQTFIIPCPVSRDAAIGRFFAEHRIVLWEERFSPSAGRSRACGGPRSSFSPARTPSRPDLRECRAFQHRIDTISDSSGRNAAGVHKLLQTSGGQSLGHVAKTLEHFFPSIALRNKNKKKRKKKNRIPVIHEREMKKRRHSQITRRIGRNSSDVRDSKVI